MAGDINRLSSSDPVIRRPMAPGADQVGPGGPTGPRPHGPPTPSTGTPASEPLSRSGLDLADLLGTKDVLASRAPTGSVALDMGLERARTALLRNTPSEALSALDAVWDGAQHAEEGWFLRGGALAVQGRPEESALVVEEGLRQRPNSVALAFLLSVARVAVGNLIGAREALAAVAKRPTKDPLVLLQLALISAREGDASTADALLAKLEATNHDHPAVLWGRSALRGILAEAARSRGARTNRPGATRAADAEAGSATIVDGEVNDLPSNSSHRRDAHRSDAHRSDPRAAPSSMERDQDDAAHDWLTEEGEAPLYDATAFDASVLDIADAELIHEAETPDYATMPATSGTASRAGDSDHAGTDVATAALERFGAKVATASEYELTREARLLLRAFSAGGTLASVVNPEQAHAVRTVLTMLLETTTGDVTTTPPAVRALMRELVPQMRQGRGREAERLLRDEGAYVGEPIARTLTAMLRGVLPIADDASWESEDGAETDRIVSAARDAERRPLLAVRLGLGLIEETAAMRSAHRTPTPRHAMLAVEPDVLSELAARLFGATGAPETADPDQPPQRGTGTGGRLLVLIFGALAVVALAVGYWQVGVVVGLVAGWLALRQIEVPDRDTDGGAGTPPDSTENR